MIPERSSGPSNAGGQSLRASTEAIPGALFGARLGVLSLRVVSHVLQHLARR